MKKRRDYFSCLIDELDHRLEMLDQQSGHGPDRSAECSHYQIVYEVLAAILTFLRFSKFLLLFCYGVLLYFFLDHLVSFLG